jgi:hypothetical protein
MKQNIFLTAILAVAVLSGCNKIGSKKIIRVRTAIPLKVS